MSEHEERILATLRRMTSLKVPNLLRLYLNPWVAQTCLTLSEVIRAQWPALAAKDRFPTFLANSDEEALSGAIKLARFCLYEQTSRREQTKVSGSVSSARRRSQPAAPAHNSRLQSVFDSTPEEPADSDGTDSVNAPWRVLIIDAGGWLEDFESTIVRRPRPSGEDDVPSDAGDLISRTVTFIPGITRAFSREFMHMDDAERYRFSIIVLRQPSLLTDPDMQAALKAFRKHVGGLIISRLPVDAFVHAAEEETSPPSGPQAAATSAAATAESVVPDIVIFDGSWVSYDVPFGAFSAQADLYSGWMTKSMSTFHSTTYQPNTVSTMHFMKRLEDLQPRFLMRLQPQLNAMLMEPSLLLKTYAELFSRSLARLIEITGFAGEDVTVDQHYIRVGGRRIFDGVGGVACSLRGHSPSVWCDEIQRLASPDHVRSEVSERLCAVTGLTHHVPAVSGGSAVESALKLALAAMAPRSTIVVLKGGFGGKTLVALTGTSKPFYKQGLAPLYPDVVCVDPFAADAVKKLREVLTTYPVAVVQAELIQGVGGVREIPTCILDVIEEERRKSRFLFFVDEIQTGMHRTGPFVRSALLSSPPDLLTIGKGTSDMMFPFAIMLYSHDVAQRLEARQSQLPRTMHARFGYEVGYRSVLNTLRRSAAENIAGQVHDASRRFEQALRTELSPLSVVRDIRVFGLLIGIELDLRGSILNRLGLKPHQLYSLAMLEHARPLLMGFCQYEPHVLKFTPPLTVTPSETAEICGTLRSVLSYSSLRLATTALRGLFRSNG